MKKQSLSLVICLAFTTNTLPMELDSIALKKAIETSESFDRLMRCHSPSFNKKWEKLKQDRKDVYFKNKNDYIDRHKTPEPLVKNFLEVLDDLTSELIKAKSYCRNFMYAYRPLNRLTQFLDVELWCARGGAFNKANRRPLAEDKDYMFRDSRGLRAFFTLSNKESIDTFETQIKKLIADNRKEFENPYLEGKKGDAFDEHIEQNKHSAAVEKCIPVIIALEQALNEREAISAFIKDIPDIIQEIKDSETLSAELRRSRGPRVLIR